MWREIDENQMNLCDKDDIFQLSERFVMMTFSCVDMYVISILRARQLNNCVLGHLLVPELIIAGWEGLNLASSEELIICTVNVTNSAQTLVSSYWQFVSSWTRDLKSNWALFHQALICICGTFI